MNAKAIWAVRPASRSTVGGGHVTRCLAVAQALRLYCEVVAVLEPGSETAASRFAAGGVPIISEADAESRQWTGVILDDYETGTIEVRQWRDRVEKIVQIIDDDVPLFGVDLAINATPGLSGDRLQDTPALLGARYAMLAAPFCDRPRRTIQAAVDRLVVGIGWIDAADATDRILQVLLKILTPNISVDVLLGSASPNSKSVALLCSTRSNWAVYLDAPKPWQIIDRADISISGGGQSLLERLVLGVPTLAIAVAKNQEAALMGAAHAGAVRSCGRLDDLADSAFEAAFNQLAGDATARELMSASAQTLIDGQGAQRVASHLSQVGVARNRKMNRP